jgi:hypothetical protein
VQRLERSVGLPRLTRAFVLVRIVRDIASTNLTRDMFLASNELKRFKRLAGTRRPKVTLGVPFPDRPWLPQRRQRVGPP